MLYSACILLMQLDNGKECMLGLSLRICIVIFQCFLVFFVTSVGAKASMVILNLLTGPISASVAVVVDVPKWTVFYLKACSNVDLHIFQ